MRARERAAINYPGESPDARWRMVSVSERVLYVPEADEENVGLGITEWAKAVVVLLAGCVPHLQLHALAVDVDGSVVEIGRASCRERV